VFGRPEYVINHPSLSHQEKRIILLSWVRDELVNEQLAAEALPELKPHSRIDAVLDGLSRCELTLAFSPTRSPKWGQFVRSAQC